MSELKPAKNVNAENPWLGLTAFTEEVCEYFYGRDDEVAELLRRVRRKTLTVLFGQSGLGKTSLLQAGLFPTLRRERFVPVYIRLDYSKNAASLVAQTKEHIAATIARSGFAAVPLPTASESLWEYFHRRGTTFRLTNGEKVVPVLVFDQFEEAFTLGRNAGAEVLRDFTAELSDLVENRTPAALEDRFEREPDAAEQYDFGEAEYRVLLSLREDYLPHLEELRPVMPSLMLNRIRLTRMNGEQAFNAVLRPGGDLVVAEVARQIVAFVAGVQATGAQDEAQYEIEPSLLSLFCQQLNAKRIALHYSQLTADLLVGNRDVILQDFYEGALADQPPSVRIFIEDQLLTDSGFRENMALERARKELQKVGAPPEALNVLVDRRLLRMEDRMNVRRIELTHDILTRVVASSRDLRHVREEKAAAEERQREAERQRQHAEERAELSRKRLSSARRWFVFVALLCLVAIAFAGWAIFANKRAQEALSIADAARARSDTDQAAARAATANAVLAAAQAQLQFYDAQIGRAHSAWQDDNIGKTQSLLDALRFRPLGSVDYRGWDWYYLAGLCQTGSRKFTGHENYVNSVAFSSDGRLILSASGDSTAKVWAADSGYTLHTYGRKIERVGSGFVYNFDAQANLVVTEVIPGLSAAAAGVKCGDRILRYAEGDAPLNEVTHRVDFSLPTGPIDSESTMELLSAGEAQPHLVRVKRQQINVSGGHSSFVICAIFTPDNKRIVTGGVEGQVKIWDMEDERELFSFLAHNRGVRSLAISADGKVIATCGYNEKNVRLWNAADGGFLRVLPQSGNPTCVIFAGEKLFFVGSDDGKLRKWSIDGDAPLEEWDTGGIINSIAATEDGRWLAAGMFGWIELRDLKAGNKKANYLIAHAGKISALAFNAGGTSLASAAADATVKIWSTEKAAEIAPLPTKLLRTLKGHTAEVRGVAFSPDGRSLASAAVDHTIRVWDLRLGGRDAFRSPEEGANRVRFSADGRLLATTAPKTNAVNIVDAITLEIVRTIPQPARYLEFAPSGHRLVAGDDSGVVRLLDADTGAEISSVQAHTGGVSAIAISPNGKTIASGGPDQELKLWTPGESQARTLVQTGNVNGIAFSPDGRLLAFFDQSAVRLWSFETRSELRPINANAANSLRFSPDGSCLVVGQADGQLQLWHAEDQKWLGTLTGHPTTVNEVAFSPDSRRLVSSGADNSVRVWDLENRSELFVLEDGPNTSSLSVTFSPEGRRVATAGTALKLWDAATLAVESEPNEWQFFFERAVLRDSHRQWEQAVNDFSKAIALGGNEPQLWYLRASARAEAGDLAGAARDAQDAFERGYEPLKSLYVAALLARERQDDERYRAACVDALKAASNQTQESPLNTAAWMCTLGPLPDAMVQEAVALGARAVQANPSYFQPHNTYGAVLYRAARYGDAVREFNESIRLRPESGEVSDAQKASIDAFDWLYLAMANQKLGRAREAQEWLGKATQSMEQTDFERSLEGNFDWSNRLELQLLRREAEALVRNAPPAAEPTPTPMPAKRR